MVPGFPVGTRPRRPVRRRRRGRPADGRLRLGRARRVGPVETWPASLPLRRPHRAASRASPWCSPGGRTSSSSTTTRTRPLIGAKHPAIGEDIRLTLAEGWDALGPPIEHAMTTLEASWLPGLLLLLERAGYREETYFTVSHAPAFGDDGRVAGMHAVCTEVTGEVLGEPPAAAAARRCPPPAAGSATSGRPSPRCARALERRPARRALRGRLPLRPRATRRFRRVAAVGLRPRRCCRRSTGPTTRSCRASSDRLGVTGGPFGDPVTEAVVLPLHRRPGRRADRRCWSRARARTWRWTTSTGPSTSWWPASSPVRWSTSARFEAERRRAEALAELDRAKTTFFSDVSHELRTPADAAARADRRRPRRRRRAAARRASGSSSPSPCATASACSGW